ncbi:MAG: large conductance mechanosensitive channel protein MscL [Clostridiales bacterium]|nr:large conductance mechanosensitive channel protein MscL [Clostridiales bacterium]
MKKFFQDFKKFISKGNIIDMSIGVIVGSAFSAIVTALTNKIIMPLINWLLAMGGAEEGLASAFTFLKKATLADDTIDLANSIYIDWGAFITAILNFLIIAMTLFIIMKVAKRSSEFFKEQYTKTVKDIESKTLCKEERKELKANGISLKDKAAIKAYFAEKEAKEQAIKKAEEEAKKAAEEEAKKNSTEYLLKEIRDLLVKNQTAKSE